MLAQNMQMQMQNFDTELDILKELLLAIILTKGIQSAATS